ncbi:putative ubiquitin interaction domain-containing protein [Botrytis cinerea BcDW1]|uniref:Putative ubiquitin interaction domain-containing protein n=1 Tax=Botryotinia fuckeliana (strain BcDW1) TaxID=1290391 RepID=M7TPU7_BOTF1|nr:putative ubiquitin interaction domain-containing protein [Botrytis cinerea BcDW1]
MAAQPAAQDVQSFLDMTGQTNRQEAILRLKGNNNNVQQAINEYYDDLDLGRNPNRYTWDDSQFNRDRDGGGAQHAFAVQGPDEFPAYSHFESAAPSRPPSRTSNNKSPLSKVVDLTTNNSTTAFTQYVDNDDKELQQALAASMADSSLPPQESGVVGTDQPYFGPATRSDYGDNWAMVPISTVKEIYQDPEPWDRLRIWEDKRPTCPAFLKPSGDAHRLGALLTIYYNIPVAREVFLRRENIETYYPYETGWWSGRPIEYPIASLQEDPNFVADDRRFGQELQKVMAFLDKTERSYGSVDVITELPYMQQNAGNDVETDFFLCFKNLMQGKRSLKHIFSSAAYGTDPDPDGNTIFAIFDLHLPTKDSLTENLYDLADGALWDGCPLTLENSPFLNHLGDVISFRIKGDKHNDQKAIEVPAVWYPDRYLQFASEDSLAMRTEKHNLQLKIQDISRQERQLKWTTHNGKTLLVEDVMKLSLNHDQNELPPSNKSISDLTSEVPMGGSKSADLSKGLKKLMDNVNAKLKKLQDEREKAKEAWRELSTLYTDPAKTSRELHRYTLRGVSLTKETTYVCTHIVPDLIDFTANEAERIPLSDGQWWRMHFSTSSPPSRTVEKTTLEKVLEDIKVQNETAILVYASDEAMEMATRTTPPELTSFVYNDNAIFRQELPMPQPGVKTPDESQHSPKSPGKRKREQHTSSSAYNDEWNGVGSSSNTSRNSNTTMNDERNDVTNKSSYNDASWATSQSSALQARYTLSDPLIVGVDPFPNDTPQEMQERRGSSMLQNFTGNSVEKGVINDSMEIEDIETDDMQREEEDISLPTRQKDDATAIKQVGFVE